MAAKKVKKTKKGKSKPVRKDATPGGGQSGGGGGGG